MDVMLTGPSGSSTSGTGVLTTDTELPVVSQTPRQNKNTLLSTLCPLGGSPRQELFEYSPVGPDLLQLLNVVSQLLVDNVGDNVQVLSIDNILPSVQEPGGDLELSRVLHDGNDSLELIGVELSGTVRLRTRRARNKSDVLGWLRPHIPGRTAC
jgi:hypothetical protein